MHLQSVINSLLDAELVKAGHAVHVVTEEAAIEPEYVFGEHGVHVPTPVVGLYVPITQAVHAAPSEPKYPAKHVQL